MVVEVSSRYDQDSLTINLKQYMNYSYQILLNGSHNRTAHIAVLGLGYVGLPLAVIFAEAGFPVTDKDPDQQ